MLGALPSPSSVGRNCGSAVCSFVPRYLAVLFYCEKRGLNPAPFRCIKSWICACVFLHRTQHTGRQWSKPRFFLRAGKHRCAHKWAKIIPRWRSMKKATNNTPSTHCPPPGASGETHASQALTKNCSTGAKIWSLTVTGASNPSVAVFCGSARNCFCIYMFMRAKDTPAQKGWSHKCMREDCFRALFAMGPPRMIPTHPNVVSLSSPGRQTKFLPEKRKKKRSISLKSHFWQRNKEEALRELWNFVHNFSAHSEKYIAVPTSRAGNKSFSHFLSVSA